MIENRQIVISTEGKGLYEFTSKIHETFDQKWPDQGLLNIFIKHTSASLIIQENADPTAKQDLEEFLERLAPENQSWHKHTLEGPDDTTSHLKSCLTQTSLTIPIESKKLALGTWQGVYLWEHRTMGHNRNILLTLYS